MGLGFWREFFCLFLFWNFLWGFFPLVYSKEEINTGENTEHVHSYSHKYALTIPMKHERILMH